MYIEAKRKRKNDRKLEIVIEKNKNKYRKIDKMRDNEGTESKKWGKRVKKSFDWMSDL